MWLLRLKQAGGHAYLKIMRVLSAGSLCSCDSDFTLQNRNVSSLRAVAWAHRCSEILLGMAGQDHPLSRNDVSLPAE